MGCEGLRPGDVGPHPLREHGRPPRSVPSHRPDRPPLTALSGWTSDLDDFHRPHDFMIPRPCVCLSHPSAATVRRGLRYFYCLYLSPLTPPSPSHSHPSTIFYSIRNVTLYDTPACTSSCICSSRSFSCSPTSLVGPRRSFCYPVSIAVFWLGHSFMLNIG